MISTLKTSLRIINKTKCFTGATFIMICSTYSNLQPHKGADSYYKRPRASKSFRRFSDKYYNVLVIIGAVLTEEFCKEQTT